MAKGEKKRLETHLAECPTYKLNWREYSGLGTFLGHVKTTVERWGACKIVPPPGKERELAADLANWVLSTRRQRVHELQERHNEEATVEACYQQWLDFTERPQFQKHPNCGSVSVNIFKLYIAVQRRGGFERVSEERGWREVCKILQVSFQPRSPASLPFCSASAPLIWLKPCCTLVETCTRKSGSFASCLATASLRLSARQNNTPIQQYIEFYDGAPNKPAQRDLWIICLSLTVGVGQGQQMCG